MESNARVGDDVRFWLVATAYDNEIGTALRGGESGSVGMELAAAKCILGARGVGGATATGSD